MSTTPTNPPDQLIAAAPKTGRHRRTIRRLTGGSALMLLVGIAYWPSFGGGFVWDDLVLVAKNPLVTGELNLRTVWLGTDFSLSLVVSWLQWLVFGEQPAGYRVVNALLHGASAILWWRVLRQVRVPGAWLGAALFAIHPVAVASVAWISELKNTLSLPFFLLSGWAFLAFQSRRKAGSGGSGRGYYWLSGLAFLLALLAKTATIMLPMLLLAAVWWRDGRPDKRCWGQLIPHFVLAGFFGLMTIWFQSEQAIRGVTVQTGNWGERLADAGTAGWFYLGKILWPLQLSAIYPSWQETLPGALRYLPLLLGLAGLGLAWRYRRGWGRPVGFTLGCFVVALFPVLGLFDMYFMVFSRVSDHFAYVALGVITAALAAGIRRIPHPRVATGGAVLLMAGWMGLTWQRATVYATDETLWRDTVAKNPHAGSAHNNLACNLAERGQLAAAREHFERALQLNPANAEAQRNLGRIFMSQGRFPEAETHFQAALKLRPNDTETLTTYATALAEQRHVPRAIELLRKAVQYQPEVATRLQLARLLAATQNHAAAIAELKTVLDARPDSGEALNNLAWMRATCPVEELRDGAEALRLAQEACRRSGGAQPIPFGTLAAAYAETGDFPNAVKAAQTAIELAEAAGNESFAAMNRQLQKLYQSGRAFRTGKNH